MRIGEKHIDIIGVDKLHIFEMKQKNEEIVI